MKILITGSCGFIGFHTVRWLCNLGHEVIGIDDINNHYDRKMKLKRLEYLKRYDYKFIKSDINNIKTLDKIFKNNKFDIVINLAARAGVRNSIENPHIYYKTNIGGLLNILECMKKYGVKKIIQASTSSVYGDVKSKFKEDMNTDDPLTPYAASKKAAEVLLRSYYNLYKFDITIFRFFTVYGTFGRPDMSIFRFIKAIYEGSVVKLFGDGNQMRDFTHVDDITNAINLSRELTGFNIINLGNDSPVKINKVISLIENALLLKAKIEYHEKNDGDINKTCANINKANKLINWKPFKSIEKGLSEAIDWYILNKDWLKGIKTGD